MFTPPEYSWGTVHRGQTAEMHSYDVSCFPASANAVFSLALTTNEVSHQQQWHESNTLQIGIHLRMSTVSCSDREMQYAMFSSGPVRLMLMYVATRFLSVLCNTPMHCLCSSGCHHEDRSRLPAVLHSYVITRPTMLVTHTVLRQRSRCLLAQEAAVQYRIVW